MLKKREQYPAISSGTGANYTTKPDLRYGLKITEGMTLQSETGINFRTLSDINFKFSSSTDPMDITIYESNNNVPVTYLLKKGINIESGNIATEYFQIGNAEKYYRLALANTGVTEIISCTDDDGNNWHEVDFLAQDAVFQDIENTAANNDSLYTYADQAPYLLKLLKTSRRFITYIREDNKTELRFGAGISDSPDEEIIPNPDSVGSSLPGSPSKLGQGFDPANFLNTRTYGQAPSNTTLVITYRYGGGVNHNVRSNSITTIKDSTLTITGDGLSTSLISNSKNSVIVNNDDPTSGGKGAESLFSSSTKSCDKGGLYYESLCFAC